MNRGIALGIVFALALTIFVIVDEQRFKKEEDIINQTILNYMDDVAKLNIEVSSLMTPGEKATETQITAAKEKFSSFLANYYIAGKTSTSEGFGSEEIESSFDSYLKTFAMPIITEQTFSHIPNNLEISKNGAGGAHVTISGMYIIKLKGNLNVFFPGDRNFYSMNETYYYNNSKPGEFDGSNENSLSYDKLYSVNCPVNGNFYLRRTSDGWKIISSSGNLNVHQPIVVTAKAQNNEDNSLLFQKYTIPECKKYMGGFEI